MKAKYTLKIYGLNFSKEISDAEAKDIIGKEYFKEGINRYFREIDVYANVNGERVQGIFELCGRKFYADESLSKRFLDVIGKDTFYFFIYDFSSNTQKKRIIPEIEILFEIVE